jgi:hypothetical protein
MKFCYECGRITAGEPSYCNFCGRSYDVKLCNRGHVNPRIAEVCSQCGSRELSTPQPKVSGWWRVLEFLVRVGAGVLFVLISLYAFLIAVQEVLRRPEFQMGLFALGILIGLLWWMWSQLPEWFRKVVRRSLGRKEQRHER